MLNDAKIYMCLKCKKEGGFWWSDSIEELYRHYANPKTHGILKEREWIRNNCCRLAIKENGKWKIVGKIKSVDLFMDNWGNMHYAEMIICQY
jgi:hypothetical protein